MSTALTVLILHNVESVYFFYSNPVFSGGKGGRCVRMTTLPPSCAVVMKSGNRNFLEPSGPLQACNVHKVTNNAFKNSAFNMVLNCFSFHFPWFCCKFIGQGSESLIGKPRQTLRADSILKTHKGQVLPNARAVSNVLVKLWVTAGLERGYWPF